MEHAHNEIGHPITNMLMREATAGDMATGDHVDGAGAELAREGVDQVENELAQEVEEAFTEIEHMVEGARDAIERRLEQFDQVDARLVRIEAMLVRLYQDKFGPGVPAAIAQADQVGT